jgi:hypothetical protein
MVCPVFFLGVRTQRSPQSPINSVFASHSIFSYLRINIRFCLAFSGCVTSSTVFIDRMSTVSRVSSPVRVYKYVTQRHRTPPRHPRVRDWRGERDRLRSGCRTEDAARTSSTRTRLKQAPAQEPSMRLYAQQRPVADRLLVMSCRGLIEVSQAAARSQNWKKNDCTNAACEPPAGGNMDDWGERTFAGHRHG